MPNWVFNSLSISGEPEKVIKIKEQVSQPFSKQYDEWVFETKSYVRKEVYHSNPVFAFWNIIRPPVDKMDEYNTTFGYNGEDGKTGDTEFNWYIFNNREWGTKWDVSVSDNDKYPETELITDEPDNIQYCFQTAWSPPVRVIETLSKQHPDCIFDLEYEEEQGWGGEIVFKNGVIVTESEYETHCHECDSYDTMDWDEEEEVTKCKKCGYEW